MQLLSKKGVLFLASGFNQSYVFQNIAKVMDQSANHEGEYQMSLVLCDGQVYISAIYILHGKDPSQVRKCENIQQFDILKITAQYQGSAKPILVRSFEIMSQNHQGLYGAIPISLYDYLEVRMSKSNSINGYAQSKTFEKEQHLNQNLQNAHSVQIQIDNSVPHNQPDNQQDQQLDDQQVKQLNDQQAKQLDNQQVKELNDQQVKQIIQFSQSQSQSQYDLLNFIANLETKKRGQKDYQKNEEISEPHKKIKLNEEEISQKIPKNDTEDSSSTIPLVVQLDKELNKNKHTDMHINQQSTFMTQRNQLFRTKQVDVIDLDDLTTQKEKFTFYPKTNKKTFRKSHLKSLEAIFEIQDQQFRPPQIQVQDQVTVPKSQVFVQPQITPAKDHGKQQMALIAKGCVGPTTSKKKMKEQFNILISNLYEEYNSFKIICRVNYLQEWTSKNGTPCIGAELMDMQGNQIKAIIYMSHSSRQCEQCSHVLQVGKVYCFQNGQCKRNPYDKRQLELIFNLRPKNNLGCTAKNKIIPAFKIVIEPLFQGRVQSICQIIQGFDLAKHNLFNTYGILESFRISQYQQKGASHNNNGQNSAQILNTEQNCLYNQNTKTVNPSNTQTENITKIYLNGYIVDPIQKRKIFFNAVIPKSDSGHDLTTEHFLQRNFIRRGALVVLHNVKVNSLNNYTVKKLQKTKDTYIQVVSHQPNLKWIYNRNQFAAESISITGKIQKVYGKLNEILVMTAEQLEEITRNPRFIDYSQQPYTLRSIAQMNGLLENHILPEQFCHTQLSDVKIHSIQQQPSIDICQYCNKKVSSQNNSLIALFFCTKCKKMCRKKKMHIFSIAFADDSSSFYVQLIKDGFIETILGLPINKFMDFAQEDRKNQMQLIKYSEFILKIKSQKKVGSINHKITAIQRMPISAKIDQIKSERRGLQKHHQRLSGSW